MTIDEAIEKFKFIANSDTPCPRFCMLPCDKCVGESKQLAEWLEELKELRKIKEDYSKGMQTSYATFMYNKAIDDFVKMCDEVKICDIYDCVSLYDIEHMAERLKAGGENE